MKANVFIIAPVGHIFDRVTETWPPPGPWFGGGRPESGSDISHAFGHDEIERVGGRIGECVYSAFVDTTGLFFDRYARPMR